MLGDVTKQLVTGCIQVFGGREILCAFAAAAGFVAQDGFEYLRHVTAVQINCI
jgi:hypothetical protein